MPIHIPKREAKLEAKNALDRHIEILDSANKWLIQENINNERFFYLSAIPIIYSAWEGYFRLTCAICLKRICIRGARAKKYNHGYSTLWLQKEKFLESFLQSLLNSMSLGKEVKKMSSGRFNSLKTFVGKMQYWLEEPLNHSSNFDELVMTYSNVNAEVTRLNADIIGLDLSSVDLSKLDEMLGRRNDVSHGGLIAYPTKEVVIGLILYTKLLLKQFHSSVDAWIEKS